MTDFTRLNILLKASAGQNANRFKPLDHDSTHATPKAYIPVILRPVSASLLEGLIYNIKHDKPLPRSPLTSETKAGLEHILHLLDESITTTSSTMANRFPSLTTSDLPRASPEEAAATTSPARGTAMLNSIFKSVRVPEFRHKWLFWAEKGQSSTPKDKSTTSSEDFASRPKPLGETIISVKEFYQHFNNIPVENLRLRDSIHLFHLGIKPVWEDPRNTKGGAWYFKVSKETASQFWHEICLLAVGDILQGAVETKRACKSSSTFKL